MFKVGICDDDPICRSQLSNYIQQIFEEKRLIYTLKEYCNGAEFLKDPEVDILLLDIEMDKLGGIALKKLLEKQKSEVRMLFVSNHSEAMAEAFGKHVFGFMKKPISYCELRNRIETILDDMADDIEVSYTRSERNTKIRTLEILYIKSYGRYTYLTLTHKKDPIFSDISISKWKGELERHGFYQCHRSFLVNMYYIQNIRNDIQLFSGDHIPLSRRIKDEFKEAYLDYIRRKGR